MSFLNHPSLQRLIEDAEKAKKKWTPPTERGVIEEVKVKKRKTPPTAFKSFEERMLRALLVQGSLTLRVTFDLMESDVSPKGIRHHFRFVPGGGMRVKLENQGRFLGLIEEIRKLGVDFVREKK